MNKLGYSKLELYIIDDNYQKATYYIDKLSNIDEQDCYGNSLLILASYYNRLRIVQYLVQKGANIYIKNKEGKTAYDVARIEGNSKIVEYLYIITNEPELLNNVTDYELNKYLDGVDKCLNQIKKPQITQEEFLSHITNKSLTLEIVKEWVEGGGNPNIQDKWNWTALIWASYYGHLDIIKYLIKKGAKLDIQDHCGNTALMSALTNGHGHLDIFKLLVENGADINIQNYKKWSVLSTKNQKIKDYLSNIIQIKKPQITQEEFLNHINKGTLTLDICKKWIDSGGNINIQNKEGNTALMLASSSGYLDIVQYLVEKGAKIDLQNNYSNTALIRASENGHLEIVKVLVEKGAKASSMLEKAFNMNLQNQEGKTALIRASERGHLDIVKLLIEKGAKIDQQDISGKTALMWASHRGRLEITQYLVEKGADINLQNKYGHTTLIYASENGYLEIVKLLVEKGADINHQNKDGWTALMWASFRGHLDETSLDETKFRLEIVKLLVEIGAKIDIKNNYGRTALDLSKTQEIKNYLSKVKLLVENSAKIDIKNNYGRTALDLSKTQEIKNYLSKVKSKVKNKSNVISIINNDINQLNFNCISYKQELNQIKFNIFTYILGFTFNISFFILSTNFIMVLFSILYSVGFIYLLYLGFKNKKFNIKSNKLKDKYYKYYDKFILNETITLIHKNGNQLTGYLQVFDSLGCLIIKTFDNNLIELNIDNNKDYVDFQTKLNDSNKQLLELKIQHFKNQYDLTNELNNQDHSNLIKIV